MSPQERGASFHAIAITTKGYRHIARLDAICLKDAAREVQKHQSRISGTVLRDGSTGKRYSIRECEHIAAGTQP